MNSFLKFIPFMAGLSMMVACSDENVPSVPEKSKGDFYTAVAVNFPTGTRSATNTGTDDDYTSSNAGTEVGQDYENKVNSVAIVLASTDDDPVVIAWEQVGPSSADQNVYTAAFQSSELERKAGKEFQTFVFCNPTVKLTGQLAPDTKLSELKFILEDGDDDYIWTKNAFLMSNASLSEVKTLPLTTDFHNYNSPQKAFSLGMVDVERTAVRFDLKKGTGNNVYDVVNGLTQPEDARLELTHVGLFNMSKESYYLRRVSFDGTDYKAPENNWSLAKPEQIWTKNPDGSSWFTGNYVVDTDNDYKSKYVYSNVEGMANTAVADHFFYDIQTAFGKNDYISSADNVLYWTEINSIFNDESKYPNDNDETWGDNKTNYEGYKIWRYATENTIPSVTQQKLGISTGVYFRTKIVAKSSSSKVAQAMAAHRWLYAFENHLIGSWKDVLEAADQNVGSTLAAAVEAVRLSLGSDKKKAGVLQGLGFTVYQPSSDGNYYVGYAYKNRHNDNGDNKLMGQMEFATVRNNVYKLQLSEIKMWGHPMNPGGDPNPNEDPEYPDPDPTPDPDPDPDDPDDPDESDEVYFTVNVTVLPWVVRINNVSF